MNAIHRWYCRSGHWRRTVTGTLAPWVLQGAALGDDVLEIGAGPGVVTDVLRARAARVTAVEIDAALAATLARRLDGGNVTVVQADATALPLPDARFSAAVCCTMLHHVPSPALQDRLLAEVRRVLRPGGVFVGFDSRTSATFRLVHVCDTLVPVEPRGFAARLEAAGFRDVVVRAHPRAFRFRAVRPA
jgi:ubiquinone/menaquinone biosynthesis C-methylase UbiE